jgi:hypothetical protein
MIVKQRGLNFCQNFYFKNQSERKIQRTEKHIKSQNSFGIKPRNQNLNADKKVG